MLDKKEIAFVGRLDNNQKNISFLNKITEYADSINKKIKIHVYGNGSDKHIIENNPNIIFHGEFSHERLHEVYKHIKVLVLPSKFEGFGYAIVDAFASGTPCIIANTYLNADYLVNNSRGKLINGFEVKTGFDAIVEIDNLPFDKYQVLSKNCKQFWSEHLTNEVFAKKGLSIINKFSTEDTF